jgi:hypothetical protein
MRAIVTRTAVERIRHLITRGEIATLICTLALAMKLIVPGGYMVSADRGWPVVSLCPQVAALPWAHRSAGHHVSGHDHAAPDKAARPELPCAFTALTAAITAAAVLAQVATPIVYLRVLASAPIYDPTLRGSAQVRPPPRGPPRHR